jgi:hypothetical protein
LPQLRQRDQQRQRLPPRPDHLADQRQLAGGRRVRLPGERHPRRADRRVVHPLSAPGERLRSAGALHQVGRGPDPIPQLRDRVDPERDHHLDRRSPVVHGVRRRRTERPLRHPGHALGASDRPARQLRRHQPDPGDVRGRVGAGLLADPVRRHRRPADRHRRRHPVGAGVRRPVRHRREPGPPARLGGHPAGRQRGAGHRDPGLHRWGRHHPAAGEPDRLRGRRHPVRAGVRRPGRHAGRRAADRQRDRHRLGRGVRPPAYQPSDRRSPRRRRVGCWCRRCSRWPATG